MAEHLARGVKEAAAFLAQAEYGVALTGAGVSTESGIPDFRSPGSGLWTRLDPMFFTIESFKADPAQFYRLGQELFAVIKEAEPNDTHIVLGELEKRGLVKAIITQNIDGLHQKGGARRVLEIHGSLESASCIGCGCRVSMEGVIGAVLDGILPPRCSRCGDPLKPDIILFGEAMPPVYQEALLEAEKADCIMVIGSSMQVSPANLLPRYSENLIIINREPTVYDSRARVVLRGNTAPVMRSLLDELELCYGL